MALGKRKRHAKQASMWVATHDLPRSAAHPFYTRLNQILDKHEFDGYLEGLCQGFYADEDRPGLPNTPVQSFEADGRRVSLATALAGLYEAWGKIDKASSWAARAPKTD